jgi:hypothetical protein
MRMAVRLVEVAFWIGLILWVSAVVTAGVSAAMAFPTMHEYHVEVPRFAAFPASEHWSIAAGLLMERMFFVTDIAQLLAGVLVLLGLGAGYALGGRLLKRPAEVLRTACVLGVIAVVAYRALALAPEMNRTLHQYWDAAQAGSTEVALERREAFQSMHPTASRLYGVSLVLLLGAAVTTAWAPPDRSDVRRAARTSDAEVPALLRKGRP